VLPPHLGGGRGARGGDEEVDAAALELRVRRQDDDLVSGAGRPGVGERVVGVRTKRPRGQSWQIDGEVRPEPDGAVASPPLWKPKRASPAPPGGGAVVSARAKQGACTSSFPKRTGIDARAAYLKIPHV